jgi:hypothetical protein
MEDSRTSSLSATQLGIGLTILQCVVAIPVVLAIAAPPKTTTTTKNDRAVISTAAGGESTSSTSSSSLSKLLSTTLPETMANIVMYGPAAAIAYWKAGFLQLGAAAATTNPSSRVPLLLLAHFGKKAVEKILMKGQTGPTSTPEEEIPVPAMAQTAAFCSVGTYLVAAQALPVPAGIDFAQVVFWLGQLGNSFHAYVLEQYQKKSGGGGTSTQQRGIPDQGGLYQFNVAAPQLLFEILAWLGIAASARSVSGYVQAGLAAVVIAYQAKRLNDNAAASDETSFLSRGGVAGVIGGEAPAKLTKKRWNLIPYIY